MNALSVDYRMEPTTTTAKLMASRPFTIADLITTRCSVGQQYANITASSTSHVTELNAVSGSGVTLIRPAAELIAATLVMSACIAATIFGNVLVVLSVFTYCFHIFTFRSALSANVTGLVRL